LRIIAQQIELQFKELIVQLIEREGPMMGSAVKAGHSFGLKRCFGFGFSRTWSESAARQNKKYF